MYVQEHMFSSEHNQNLQVWT